MAETVALGETPVALGSSEMEIVASRSGVTEPAPKELGEAETTPKGSGEMEPHPIGLARWSPLPEVGRGEAHAPRVGWSYSHAFDSSDESMLMTISSSSLGTLVLVPDSSPRAYGGAENSF